MKQYDFEGSAIRSLRSVITTHWLSLMPASRENGWHKSKINPMTLLDYFGSLRIKPGYVLRAYECHRGPDSWGIVYAMPASTLFPDPKPNGDGRPPKPEGALDDVMMAITGDDTPYSYLCASLLARELEQFATLSPENEWLNCFVLDGDPWFGANGVAHTLKGQGFTKDKLNWRWSGQRPSMWRPTVFMSQRSATVSFHAFSGAGRQRIIAYEDRFLRGSYTFSRHEEPVASGPVGYTW